MRAAGAAAARCIACGSVTGVVEGAAPAFAAASVVPAPAVVSDCTVMLPGVTVPVS